MEIAARLQANQFPCSPSIQVVKAMENEHVLEEAIRTRQPVTGRYSNLVREFCPHALGTKNGERHVLVFQVAGTSTSGLPDEGEWRCLRVDRLQGLSITPGKWRTGTNVFNPQSCLDDVDAVVEPLVPRTPQSEDAETRNP